MALAFRDGDYVADGSGGLRQAEGGEAALQRALWKLTVRRGSFPFLPELGSRLHLLPREKPSARPAAARLYVMEALADDGALAVEDVKLEERADGSARLTVELAWAGEHLAGSVEIR